MVKTQGDGSIRKVLPCLEGVSQVQGDRILNFQQWQQDAALVVNPRVSYEITLKPPIYVDTGD